MFYTALGRLTWAAIKFFLRRRYGPTYVPKPLIAGVAIVAAIGAILAATRREDRS